MTTKKAARAILSGPFSGVARFLNCSERAVGEVEVPRGRIDRLHLLEVSHTQASVRLMSPLVLPVAPSEAQF
jgi:hypothetical protein